jgi:hypothetical protein
VIRVDKHGSTAAENIVIASRIAGLPDEQIRRELEALGIPAAEAAAMMAGLDADTATQRTTDVRRARKALRDDPLARCA